MKNNINDPTFIAGVKQGIKWAKHRVQGCLDSAQAEAEETVLSQLTFEIQRDSLTEAIGQLSYLLKEADDECERETLNEL